LQTAFLSLLRKKKIQVPIVTLSSSPGLRKEAAAPLWIKLG